MATDNKKILISIEVQETGSKAVSNSTKKTAEDLTKLTQAQIAQRVEAEKLKITNAAVAQSFRSQAAAQLQAANPNFRAQSGLNNAILLETSRLASDASYGFQGMANNLGQIVSLFFSFTKTAGGAVNSLKLLGRSLLGSGGILIAIQLLIAFGDDIYNFFFGAGKAADDFKKKLDELTKSIQKQIDLFDRLAKSVIKFSVNGKALDRTVSLLSNTFSTFENGMKNLKEKGLDQNDEAVTNLIKSFDRLLNIEKELILVDEKYTASLTNSGGETKESIKLNAQYERLLEEKILLEKLFQIETKKGTKASKERNRVFREGDLDFEKERQKSRQRIIESVIEDEKRLTVISFQGLRDRARIRQTEFAEDQKRRIDDFLSSNATNKQKEEAQEKFDQSIRESEKELSDFIIQLNREEANELRNISLSQTQEELEILRQRKNDIEKINKQEADSSILNEGIKARNLVDLRLSQLDAEKIFLQERLNNDNISFKQRVKLQKDLSKVEDEESSIRINIAELEAQGKRKQLELVGNALTAFSALAGKETQAGKALAITGALISTYFSAQKAYESQFMPIAIVDSPIRGALAAAAAVASGLANVKAIASEGKSRPSANQPKVNVEAPDFNIVGASSESQLAQSIGEQQTKPIKAFVVGKEITTQQELDRNTINTAGLGG